MNEDLKRDLGAAGVVFTETTKQIISTGQHHFFEFWLNTEVELLSQFRDILVKHKDSLATEELVFYSLIMGQAVQQTIEDLHKFDKENKE